MTDEWIRVAQYRQALRWWKSNSPWPVVFADNSGSSLLDEFGSEAGERCIVMAVERPPEDLVATRGKGVAEALLLRDAIERIDPNFTAIVKVTGRLTVKNVRNCFSSLDAKFVTCKVSPDLTFSDSRIFAADRSSFCFLIGRVIGSADDACGRYFEHELAAGALKLFSEGVPFRPFHRLPAMGGVSGTSGESYGSALRDPARLAHDGIRRFVSWRHLSL